MGNMRGPCRSFKDWKQQTRSNKDHNKSLKSKMLGRKGKVSGEHLGNRWVILDMWVTSNQRSNNNKICIIAPRKKRSTTRFPEKYHTVCNSLTIQRNITLSVCSYLIDGVNFEAGVMLKSFCNKSGALAITFIKSESK